MRPCDAKALSLIHRVFNENDYHDTYFNALWEGFIKIAIGCIEPLNTCFCTSFEDGSPFGTEGADILANEAKDYWILESITETGDNLVMDFEDATIDEIDEITEIKSKVIESIDNKVPVNIKDKLWNNFDNEAFWAQIGDRCISCGICTFVCPSCYCFDINDEIIDKYARPRLTQLHRIRQRIMHKLSFFAKKYKDIQLCVGCGRCIRECPVNIDIRKVAMEAELLT
jgi:ferredoxin